MEYTDIETVKSIDRQFDRHFFSPGAMRFFCSRVSREAIFDGERYWFVTSEQFDDKSPRLYTVRAMTKEGDTNTIGDFQQYPSSAAAWNAIKRILSEAKQE